MKKLLAGLLILFLFAAAGVVIFVVTFDLDRYRSEIEKKIEDATGGRAELGKLSLGLQDGLSLSVNGLALTETGSAAADLSARSFRASVRLRPLLEKRIELGRIHLSGLRAHVLRSADGSVRVKGYAPKPQGTAAAPAAERASSPSAVSLTVSSIVIEDAEVRFTDASPSFPMDLEVRNLDIRLQDVSMTRPVQFEVAASVLSDTQNIKVRGRVQPSSKPAGMTVVEGFGLRTDLAALDLERLAREIPKSSEWGLKGIQGDLTVEVPRLEIAPGAAPRADAKVSLEDGQLAHAALAERVRDIRIEAESKGQRIELEKAEAVVAGSKIAASGSFGTTPDAQHRFRVSVERFDVGRTLKPSKPGGVYLEGQVSIKFDGTATGLQQHPILETMKGQGELLAENVVIHNFNLLWEVFSKFSSAVPGLLEGLQKQLPEAMRQRMVDAKTVFGPIRGAFTVRDRSVFYEGLQLATQDLALNASGRAGFDGAIEAQMTLFVHPDFSKAAVSSAQTLQYLQDPQGQLRVGAEVSRTAQGKISIKPDLSPVLQRAVADQGQRLLLGLLEKGGSSGSAGGEAAAGSSEASSGDALSKLLSKI